MMRERGRFIALEGGEGSGKSSEARRLFVYFQDLGYEVVVTREPGGSVAAAKIRNLIMDSEGVNIDPRIALCLFLADRCYHVKTVIRPALAAGKMVVCDRFEGSTFAYQSMAEGLDLEQVRKFNDFITDGLHPDVTILLDVPPEVGLFRKGNPGLEITHYDQREVAFHQKLRAGYLTLARILPNWVVVDATQSPEEIHEQIIQILRDRRVI